MCDLSLLSLQDHSQLRTLSAGVGNSDNISMRFGSKSPSKWRPGMNPQGVSCSKIAVWNLDSHPKNKEHAQLIFHNWAAKNHTAVLDTGSQHFAISMGGWDIIKCHDS